MSNDSRLPKLRAIDSRPIVQRGRPCILLRDPLRLAGKTVAVPQHLAPMLALCDGTRDGSALRAALAVRFGLQIGPGEMDRLLAALDEALLLDNDRSAQAQERALTEYRQAPFRKPSMAGQSYPADADDLRLLLQGYMDACTEVDTELIGRRGLVSPHIDYARGGNVYASVWKRAAETVKAADLVVLLGTDHFGKDGALTLTLQHYATPFGILPTAQEAVQALAQALGTEAAFSDELRHRSEHSIELAAVWLHHVRDGKPCKLVPILCGSFGTFVRGEAEPERDPAIEGLAHALKQLMTAGRVVVVASADLSHVGPAFGGHPLGLVERAQLQTADRELIAHMCAGDALGFYASIKRDGDKRNVCGVPPIYLTLRVLRPTQGELTGYDRCPADTKGTSLVSVCGVVFA